MTILPEPDPLRDEIARSLRALPDEKLPDVLDFVESLRRRASQDEDPALKVAGCLAGPAATSEELDEVLYGGDGS